VVHTSSLPQKETRCIRSTVTQAKYNGIRMSVPLSLNHHCLAATSIRLALPALRSSDPKATKWHVILLMPQDLATDPLVSTALAGYLASTVLHDFHARFLGLAFGPIDTIFTVGSLFGLLAGMYAMVNLWGLHLAREEDGLEPEITR
jgi:hypothetical protein